MLQNHGQIVSGDSELNLEGYELFRKDRDIKNEKGMIKKMMVF